MVMRRDPTNRQVLLSYNRAKQDKANWEDLLRDAFEYALPQRNLFTIKQPGAKKVDRLFDSTLQVAAVNFANWIQLELFPPFQDWAKMVAGPGVPEAKRAEINKALEPINKAVFAALQTSNFDTSINELLLELFVSTSLMFIEDTGDLLKPVMFINVPLSNAYLTEGPYGSVDGVYFDHKTKIKNIELEWPDVTMPEELQKLVQDEPDKDVDLIVASYALKSGEWAYKVFWSQGDKKTDATPIVERTYEEQPWVAPRWIKVAGEVFGRGPGIQALPDAKTLNLLVELVLKNAMLHVSGVYTVLNDGVLNTRTIKIVPNAKIPVKYNAGPKGPSIKPLERTGAFDVAALQIDQLQSVIKRITLDQSLPDESGAVRSATEIIERIREVARNVGAPFGRLMTELIVPLVQRVLGILRRRGIIPEVKINGMHVKIQITSPLAQQQDLQDVENVLKWLSIVGDSMGEQMVMLGANVEDIPAYLGEKLNVDAKLIREEDKRNDLQKMIGAAVGAQQGVPANAGAQASVPLQVAA